MYCPQCKINVKYFLLYSSANHQQSCLSLFQVIGLMSIQTTDIVMSIIFFQVDVLSIFPWLISYNKRYLSCLNFHVGNVFFIGYFENAFLYPHFKMPPTFFRQPHVFSASNFYSYASRYFSIVWYIFVKIFRFSFIISIISLVIRSIYFI